jgi:hypothetical protein
VLSQTNDNLCGNNLKSLDKFQYTNILYILLLFPVIGILLFAVIGIGMAVLALTVEYSFY